MRGKCSFTALLWSLLPLSVAVLSTAPEKNDLPPPTNITVTIADMFHVIFKWDHSAANCTPKYNVNVSAPGYIKRFKTATRNSSWKLEIYKLPDLNNNFSMEIVSDCNGMISPVVKENLSLVPGNETVKNLSCFWQYAEHINCTWELQADAPPNVQYRLLYWEKGSNSGTLPESTRFEDLLRSGNQCYPPDGMRLGCTFRYEYSLRDKKRLMFVVTDASYSVKPYFYYTAARDIAKLRSPNITNVSEPINQVIHVNWTASPDPWERLFEVLVSSDTWSLPPHKVKNNTHASISIPHADDTFRVKVRTKFSDLVANSVFWSEWSPEWIVPGKNKTTTSILLFLLIPVVVLVAAVVLLVFLRRLKILICPPIPHPGKMFQNDLQHWLMGDRPATVYDQPEIEEITAVTALEA